MFADVRHVGKQPAPSNQQLILIIEKLHSYSKLTFDLVNPLPKKSYI
jgi:hypothetical protein